MTPLDKKIEETKIVHSQIKLLTKIVCQLPTPTYNMTSIDYFGVVLKFLSKIESEIK